MITAVFIMRSVYRTPRKFVNPEEEGWHASADGGDAYMTGQFQLWKQRAFFTLTLAAVLFCGQPVKSMGQKSMGQKSVGVNSCAVWRRRPVSTFVEKD